MFFLAQGAFKIYVKHYLSFDLDERIAAICISTVLKYTLHVVLILVTDSR